MLFHVCFILAHDKVIEDFSSHLIKSFDFGRSGGWLAGGVLP